jgi:hypothetical protein
VTSDQVLLVIKRKQRFSASQCVAGFICCVFWTLNGTLIRFGPELGGVV